MDDEKVIPVPVAEEKQPIPTEVNGAHVCPYCSDDPLKVYLMGFQMGPFEFLVIACVKCRKPIPASLKSQMQMADPRAGAGRILIPGGRH